MKTLRKGWQRARRDAIRTGFDVETDAVIRFNRDKNRLRELQQRGYTAAEIGQFTKWPAQYIRRLNEG